MGDEPPKHPNRYVTKCESCGKDFEFTEDDVKMLPTTLRKSVGAPPSPMNPMVECPHCTKLSEVTL